MRMLAFACALLSLTSVQAKPFRPCAVPLVSVDPFFSVWDVGNALNSDETEHWSGAKQPLRISAEIDGKTWLLCGANRRGEWRRFEPARQLSVEVRPLTSVYRFAAGAATVELSFTTAKLPDDFDVFSRPVTYVTVRTAGAKSVRIRAEITPAWATDDDAAAMERRTAKVAGLDAYAWGRKEQKPICRSGDQVRCDWGWAWIVNPECEGTDVHFLLAYDDVVSVSFLKRPLQAWWRRDGLAFEAMLERAEADYAHTVARCAEADRGLLARMRAAGGEKYAALAALAYRQSFAACKIVAGPEGRPLYFSKENSSNGCMGTVDLLYPQLPQLLISGAPLVEATLEPVMLYASSPEWTYGFSPHDVGRWPLGDGQVYRMDLTRYPGDSNRMPVEENGNMLIAFGALSKMVGNADYASRWWPVLTKWAEYLEAVGVDSGDQLCTDDFAGHLAHNANLGIKSIIALAAYGEMARLRGDAATADRYRKLTRGWVTDWLKMAEGGAEGGYRLAFDRPGTWSQKYNLVWDRVLGLGLFPKEVAEREMAAYRRFATPYGLALDSRETYTKTDWTAWSACLTGKREDFDFLFDRIYRYADETPDRIPFPDWYWVGEGRFRGFRARSVIGALMMPLVAR